MTIADHEDTALIAGLRTQLRRVTEERDDLRKSLELSAQLADDTEEQRSSKFWRAAWKERNRQAAWHRLQMALLRADIERIVKSDMPSGEVRRALQALLDKAAEPVKAGG